MGGEDTQVNGEITRPRCFEGRRGWSKEKLMWWRGQVTEVRVMQLVGGIGFGEVWEMLMGGLRH